ncbi:MAG TPA: D-alanyl-D-alanine carboxypeptidase family protein [Solirubrobacterales bacterium]|nr:D-alanyl-D-alanine carboxypeptidase family protein [Solirubrobacterales bacterium]
MRRLALLVAVVTALQAAAVAAPARAAQSGPPQLEARAWVLIDAGDGEVLASHAISRQLPVASTTKLMTAYVALKELPLGKVVRAAPYEAEYGESLLGLRAGQRVSVRDLLFGLILLSGNDAAYDLALAASGSEGRFVAEMNRYAAALGLLDTHYANPIGLDQPGNHSSAGDLAALTRRLLRIPAFARIAAARHAQLRSLQPPRRIETINELLEMAPWVNGVKTGHTFGARYVLVGSGRRKGVELIAVVVGAASDEERFADTLELLEYGFSRYRRRVSVRAGEALARPSVRYAGGELPLRAARSVAVGLRRGQRIDLVVRAPEEVEGPIARGAALGRAIVRVDGLRAASVPLRAGRALPEATTFERARSFAEGSLGWIALALLGILGGGALLRRRSR